MESSKYVNYAIKKTVTYTHSITKVMTVKIAPKTALLQLLFGLSACDISPPQLPQHRQQQKHNPTIGIIIMNNTPRATQMVIPRA